MTRITDELREWTRTHTVNCSDNRIALVAIADRIDAEHEMELRDTGDDIVRDVKHEWIRLPKDADGVPWHINDEFEVDEVIAHVNGIGDNRLFYIDNDGMQWTRADNKRHYRAPTVEDLLREFGEKMAENTAMYVAETWDADERDKADADTIAEYAKRLQLKEG